MNRPRIAGKPIRVASSSHKVGIKQVQKVFTYILLLDNKTFYTGITKDIEKRLQQHKAGLSKSTQHATHVKLIYSVEMPDYKQARWLKKKIKNRGAKRYLRSRTVQGIKVFA